MFHVDSVQLVCISFRFYINFSETRWTFCVDREYAEIFPAVAQYKGEDHSELGLVYAVTQQYSSEEPQNNKYISNTRDKIILKNRQTITTGSKSTPYSKNEISSKTLSVYSELTKTDLKIRISRVI
jgi:hypothetical protein